MHVSLKSLAAGLLLVCPLVTSAEEAVSPITGNLALTSNYVFRGISQTWDEPAVQGGFDYAHPSGFYVGTWASNVSDHIFNNTSIEIDLYGGYNGVINDDLSYNVGLIQYYYPGGEYNIAPSEEYDTLEAYAGVTYKFFNLKYSYSVTDFFGVNEATAGNGDSDGSGYLEANINYAIMDTLTLGLHVGHQKVENYGDLDYTDYKVSLTKAIAGFNLTAAYTNTNADEALYTYANGTGETEDISDSAFFVSVGKTF